MHNIGKHDWGLLAEDAWHHHQNYRVLGKTLTIAQVMAEVFTFDLEQRPIFVTLEDGTTVEVPNRSAIVRSDIGLPLSVMSDRYGLNQYRGYFEAIGEALERAGFPIVTAGTLGNGTKGFLSAKVPDGTWEVDGYSLIRNVVNFGDSCDGSSSMRGVNATDIVVCGNTFAANLLGVPAMFAIRHTANAEAIVDETLRELDHSLKVSADIKDAVERLCNEAFVEAEFVALLRHNDMLGERPEKVGKGQTQYDNTFAKVMSRYRADDIAPIQETQMGALMALQGYTQHERGIKKEQSRVGRTLDEVVFNGGPLTLDKKGAMIMGVASRKLIKA